MSAKFKPGDLLVYKKQKHSRKPGPRAHSIAAAVQNEEFQYVVDKFWVVEEVNEDGTLEVRTRRGKRHRINSEDTNLHRATWWQQILYRRRFRELRQGAD